MIKRIHSVNRLFFLLVETLGAAKGQTDRLYRLQPRRSASGSLGSSLRRALFRSQSLSHNKRCAGARNRTTHYGTPVHHCPLHCTALGNLPAKTTLY